MSGYVDLRANPRIRVSQLRLELPDGPRFVHGNISMGGVGFETDECLPLAVGDQIRVSLPLIEDEEALEFQAVVRHIRLPAAGERFYLGAVFEDVDVLVKNPLFRFVEENLLRSIRPQAARPGHLVAGHAT